MFLNKENYFLLFEKRHLISHIKSTFFGALFFLVSVRANFKGFLTEKEQKPQMISDHPPNSQTFNQKRKLFLLISSLLYHIIFFFL